MMAVELQVLGYAALLQYFQFVLMAVPVNLQMGVGYTAGPRDVQRQPEGVPGRLHRAMNNHFEGLILFTIAVVVVVLGDASTALTENAAWTYLVARILYVPAYAAGVFMIRSVIFAVGFTATLVMIVAALF
jgi:uncharacterized MAPEG superfamily protein